MREIETYEEHVPKNRGITLTELTASLAVIVLGLAPLAAFLIPVSQQREFALQRYIVLSKAQGVMEEIKSVDPGTLAEEYDGVVFSVYPANSTRGVGYMLKAAVDDSDPELIIVTLKATWLLGGHPETLVLRTEIFNNGG